MQSNNIILHITDIAYVFSYITYYPTCNNITFYITFIDGKIAT